MSRSIPDGPPGGRHPGCLATAAAMAGVAVLAPFAALVRTVRGWARGDAVRVRRERVEFGHDMDRIDLKLDLPARREIEFQRTVTDTVVRIAEALRRPGDVYHLISREPAADEATVLPVGPQLQELGERFHLVLAQEALRSRTAVWLTLGPGDRVVEMVDPFDYDPEAEDEPATLMKRSDMRWGMASSVGDRGPSVLVRLALFVPARSAAAVEVLLDRLQPRK